MNIAFYDYDLIIKPKKLLLNLEAMKLARYYKDKGDFITLLDNLEGTSEFDKLYICRNLINKRVQLKIPNLLKHSSKIEYLGLDFSGGHYIPMENKFEKQIAYPHLYSKTLKNHLVKYGVSIGQLENLLNSHFLRLRAGDYECDIESFKRKHGCYIYDHKIEEVSNWFEKLKYIRENLMGEQKKINLILPNGFHFTSFDNIRKLSNISGFRSLDVHLFYPCSYKEFTEEFRTISDWVSSRDGINYYFAQDVNPESNNQIVKNLCLSINKYLFVKGMGKACTFVAGTYCENSPLYKMQKNFQYWTDIRVGDVTFKEYFLSRSKENENLYNIALSTPYGESLNRLCNITKNNVKEVGWFYHV